MQPEPGAHLDDLFAETAEACRAWLLAYTEATPTPSLTTDRKHDRLIDAHHQLDGYLQRIEAVFQATP
jgi:hypothetical protein